MTKKPMNLVIEKKLKYWGNTLNKSLKTRCIGNVLLKKQMLSR